MCSMETSAAFHGMYPLTLKLSSEPSFLPGYFAAVSKPIYSQTQAGVLSGCKACRQPTVLHKVLVHP